MSWEKWAAVSLLALGCAATISMIDRPRVPISRPVALVSLAINFVIMALIVAG